MTHYARRTSAYFILLLTTFTLYSAQNKDHRFYTSRCLKRLSGTKWHNQFLDMSGVNNGKPSHHAAFMQVPKRKAKPLHQQTQKSAEETLLPQMQSPGQKRYCCLCVVL